MYLFIDESGIFSNPNQATNLVSSVAVLSIPESEESRLFERVDRLALKWGFSTTNELKGRKLNEYQVSKLITVMSDFDVVLTACIVDVGIHDPAAITNHKLGQANAATASLTPKHHPNLVRQVRELADRIRGLPDQLYLEATALTQTVSRAIQACTLHYCQSNPPELSAFKWRIDAKGQRITEYERVWSMIVKPILQSQSKYQPSVFLKEGDYSYFERFSATPEMIEQAKSIIGNNQRPDHFTDIGKVMDEDQMFLDSRDSLGLRLVDVLANTIQRACNGKLRRKGWRNLGRLMLKDVHDQKAIANIAVDPKTPRVAPPYSDFLTEADKKARIPILGMD